MKDSNNLHQKIQELCDCCAETDALKEMSTLAREVPTEEAALKWIALAILHGIGSSAREITLREDDKGEVTVTAEYRLTKLPPPAKETTDLALAALRCITHIDGPKGKSALALGFRENSLELGIKIKEEKGCKKAVIRFP